MSRLRHFPCIICAIFWAFCISVARCDEQRKIAPVQTPSTTEQKFNSALRAGVSLPVPHNIVFSEVCYWPADKQPEWIELINSSAETIDIKGWRITDGQSVDFVISSNSLEIQPMGMVVIYFDGKSEGPTTDAGKKLTVIHSILGQGGDALGNAGGQLALYSPGSVFVPWIVRSYVAWGYSPGRVISDVAKANIWFGPGPNPINIVLGSAREVLAMPARVIQQGGSIGLIRPLKELQFNSDDWGIFEPSEVNPGRFDQKRGVVLAGFTGDGAHTTDDGFATLAAVWMEDGIKYEFQVCTDPGCKEVFLDIVTDRANYFLQKPIPPKSTYYWRARLKYADGTLSDWSPVRRLIHN